MRKMRLSGILSFTNGLRKLLNDDDMGVDIGDLRRVELPRYRKEDCKVCKVRSDRFRKDIRAFSGKLFLSSWPLHERDC